MCDRPRRVAFDLTRSCGVWITLVLAVCSAAADTEKQPSILGPGKVDLHVQFENRADNYNTMFWSPIVRAGMGYTNSAVGSDMRYGGLYVRPFQKNPRWGDLIVGLQGMSRSGQSLTEFQAEYKLRSGFAIGGGMLDGGEQGVDAAFVKVAFSSIARDWTYILQCERQQYDDHVYACGHAAVYNPATMLAGGTDGEQWRGAAGFIASSGVRLKPVLEALYVDDDIGDRAGPKTWLINGTLGFNGGFLSHAARLGRALGPTGLVFSNPLGFIQPNWNRRLDPWEMGDIADVRFRHQKNPNGTVAQEAVLIAFPLQGLQGVGKIGRLFTGGGRVEDARGVSGILVGGFFGPFWAVDVTSEVERVVAHSETRGNLAIIYRF
jgi:hypothetical protein